MILSHSCSHFLPNYAWHGPESTCTSMCYSCSPFGPIAGCGCWNFWQGPVLDKKQMRRSDKSFSFKSFRQQQGKRRSGTCACAQASESLNSWCPLWHSSVSCVTVAWWCKRFQEYMCGLVLDIPRRDDSRTCRY